MGLVLVGDNMGMKLIAGVVVIVIVKSIHELLCKFGQVHIL